MAHLNLLPFFMIGMLGTVHCVGMCGGIVSAFSLSNRKKNPQPQPQTPGKPVSSRKIIPLQPVPVPVHNGANVSSASATLASIFNPALGGILSFNSGRIVSYMLAGAIAGGISQSIADWSQLAQLQIISYALANLMLIAVGLNLMQVWSIINGLEVIGQKLWRHAQKAIKYLLPIDTNLKAFAFGALWGWVPCGMVYSVLMSAMLSSSAGSGMLIMLSFGLGTLPALISMSFLGQGLSAEWIKHPKVRLACGLLILCFGLLGLIRTVNGISLGWLDTFCITPGGTHR